MKQINPKHLRRIKIGLLAGALALISLFLGNNTVYATGNPYPIVWSISTMPEVTGPGEPTSMLIQLTDQVIDATGTIKARIVSPNGKKTIELDLTRRNDGIYQGALVPGTYWEEGLWRVDQLVVASPSGGYPVDSILKDPNRPNAEDLTGGDFTIVNPKADTTPPTVKTVSVDQTKVYLGEAVTVTVEGGDNLSGLASIGLTLKDGTGAFKTVPMTKVTSTKFTAAIKVETGTNGGSWKIHKLALNDRADNPVEIFNSFSTAEKPALDLSTANFTVYAYPRPDTTRPVVSLSVDKKQVLPTDVVTLTLKVQDASAIATPITGSYKAPDYASNTAHTVKTFTFTKLTTGDYQAKINLGPGIGTWIFNTISVKDIAGNETVLTNQRLSAAGTDLEHLNVTVGLNATFDSQGGSAVAAQFSTTGLLVEPAAPVKTGWDFAGWHKEAAGLTKWNFATDKANQSITLFSKWTTPPPVVTPPVVTPPPVEEPAPAPYFAKTTATALNFRTGPTTAYPSQGTIPYGSIVTINKSVDGWFEIVYQGKTGFVSGKYIAQVSQSSIYQVKASLNFRTGPSTAYPVITKLAMGTYVELVAKTTSTWWQISVNGSKGYVSAAYLTPATAAAPAPTPTPTPTPEPVPTPPAAQTWYVVKSPVNFRTGPSTAYSIIRKLTVGTYVELVAKTSATWWQVSVNGTKGYVSASYLSPSAAPPTTAPAPEPSPEPTPTTQGYYMVRTAVNFRTGPSTAYSVIRKLNVGDVLGLISKVDATWWKVSVNGQTGYLSGKYVESVVYPLQKYVTNDSVNFRTGPSTAYTIITKLPVQTPVTLVQKTSSTWYKVLANGSIGYLSARYLTLQP